MTEEEVNKKNEERALENGSALAYPLNTSYTFHRGMTKREYMATQLMSGLLSHGHDINTAATHAVNATDILLIQLNKEK